MQKVFTTYSFLDLSGVISGGGQVFPFDGEGVGTASGYGS